MAASSSRGARTRVACDACGTGAWVGPRADGFDAWCERCQSPASLARAPSGDERCPRCHERLHAELRFPALWGALQDLEGVLAAWAGDPAPLAALVPERPVFLTDLTPPAPRPDDPPARFVRLAAAAHGEWAAALAGPADDEPRALAARAIACERGGDPEGACAAWTAALAHGEWAQARLARGALHARAGRAALADADLARAGDGFPARWNRAALALVRAVAEAPALPPPGVLAAARAEAGEASDDWSDPTVGRLLWTLLVARAGQRRAGGGAEALPDEAGILRAAEDEFEHRTFWDAAQQIAGHARLGHAADVARLAAPLAGEQVAALLAEPPLHGEALADVARALARAHAAIGARTPDAARALVAPLLAHAELRRFRIPCQACGRGSLGVAEVEESLVPGEDGP